MANLQLSSYTSNPFTTSDTPREDKIKGMKEAQEAKRAELNENAKEYEALYKDQLKEYVKATSLFLIEKDKFKSLSAMDSNYTEQQEAFNVAKKNYYTQRSKKDLQLDLYLFRADIANKASRVNILDLV